MRKVPQPSKSNPFGKGQHGLYAAEWLSEGVVVWTMQRNRTTATRAAKFHKGQLWGMALTGTVAWDLPTFRMCAMLHEDYRESDEFGKV